MINWILPKYQSFPKDGITYLALVKGNFALLRWDEDINKYQMAWLPGAYDTVWEFTEEDWGHKIYAWANLTYPHE